jgi:hypothetical protein
MLAGGEHILHPAADTSLVANLQADGADTEAVENIVKNSS